MFKQREGKLFVKVLDEVNAGLLMHGVVQSFEKINDMLSILTEKKIVWQRAVTVKTIQKCIELNGLLFTRLNELYKIKTMASDNSSAIQKLKAHLPEEKKVDSVTINPNSL